MLAPTLDVIPPIRSGRRGRPRKRPDKLHADKGYDHRRCRRECRTRHIRPRIARRGVDGRQRLGRHRWVVERTHAWLNRMRRLVVRYERRADIHLAFTTLGCALTLPQPDQAVLLDALIDRLPWTEADRPWACDHALIPGGKNGRTHSHSSSVRLVG